MAVWEKNELYPVRFELTEIQDINSPWYLVGEDSYKRVLHDVFFGFKSLYELQKPQRGDPNIDWKVVLGNTGLQTTDHYEVDYRNKYPAQYICEDGHKVRSLSEQAIDNWLYRHRVVHAYEPVVPISQELIPDFRVDSPAGVVVYIEFWGRLDDPDYLFRMKKKSQIYVENNLSVINLEPKDLETLDSVLAKKLRQKNIIIGS